MYKDWAVKQKLPNADKVVTNDPMEATFVGIHMWKRRPSKRQSPLGREVIAAMAGSSAPCGFTIKMRPTTICGSRFSSAKSGPTGSSTSYGRPKARSAPSRGVHLSRATRRSRAAPSEAAAGAQDTDPWNGGGLRAGPPACMLSRLLFACCCVLVLFAAPRSPRSTPRSSRNLVRTTPTRARCRPQAGRFRGSARSRHSQGA